MIAAFPVVQQQSSSERESMMVSLSGKTALVTGASRGIGTARPAAAPELRAEGRGQAHRPRLRHLR